MSQPLFGISLGAIGVSHYASTEYQLKQAATAIQKDQFTEFKRICPQFTTGQKIDRRTFQLFRKSLGINPKLEKIEKQLKDTKKFERKNEKNWWKATQFYAIPRTVKVEKEETTEIIPKILNKTVQMKNSYLGPFIASKYSIEYTLNNKIYGVIKETKEADLNESNKEWALDEPMTYIQNEKFQKTLLNRVVTYYVSMNQCIQNDLSFSGLEAVTSAEKEELQAEFEELRPYMNSLKQRFQIFIANSESFKVDGGNEPQVTFDLYTDDELTLQLKKETGVAEPLSEQSHNAEVTMKFDPEQKTWLIQTIDFETYDQDPKEWSKQQQIKLPQVNQGTWSSENTKGII